MKLVGGHIICACGWHGVVAGRGPCPACKRIATSRMDPERIAALRAVHARSDADIHRSQALRLIEIGVLRSAGAKIPPNESGRHKRLPRRHYALTAMGLRVVATADHLDAVAAQTRHDVAASVVRHAGLSPAQCCERDHDHDGNCDRHPDSSRLHPQMREAIARKGEPGLAGRLLDRPGARVEFTAHDRMEVPDGE